ncbi:MAG: hypothetical protein IKS05_09880 [Oscillospiraceae bacterium]|nr:hypothetical protein [Oscillospiraceae bacterium]
MDSTLIFIVLIAVVAVLMIVVGWIGNKFVDKTTDAVRNKAVRKQNAQAPQQSERLADRLEKGRKL